MSILFCYILHNYKSLKLSSLIINLTKDEIFRNLQNCDDVLDKHKRNPLSLDLEDIKLTIDDQRILVDLLAIEPPRLLIQFLFLKRVFH
jgi:hypothetical protein